MNNTINSVSFSGNMAKAYLQKKASQQARLAAEKTKEAARMLINSNQKAARSNQYVGVGAYFGNVPTTQRAIGHDKTMQSIAVSKSIVPKFNETKPATIEPNFNFFG